MLIAIGQIIIVVAAPIRRASLRGIAHALTLLSSQSMDQKKPTFCHIIFASQPLHPGDATARQIEAQTASREAGIIVTTVITVWSGVWPLMILVSFHTILVINCCSYFA